MQLISNYMNVNYYKNSCLYFEYSVCDKTLFQTYLSLGKRKGNYIFNSALTRRWLSQSQAWIKEECSALGLQPAQVKNKSKLCDKKVTLIATEIASSLVCKCETV